MQVLFVDDDHALSQSVAMALRQQGHSCQIAELGEQALAFAREAPYDIIVLDVALPDIDGFEVIQLLKWEGLTTPVLLESGLTNRDLASEAAVLGIDEFLAKPFSIAELIARMETVIARAGQDAAARRPEPTLAAGDDGWESDSVGPEEGLATQGAEQRRHDRTAMFGAALIMAGDKPIPCVILDVSAGGAALRLTEPDQQCPTLFSLEPLDGAPRRCEVRWRRGDTLGVEFV